MPRIVFNLIGLTTLGALLGACTDLAGPIPSTAGTGGSSVGNAGGSPPAAGTGGSSVATGGTGSNADLVSFDDDVHPILEDKCVPCHESAGDGLPVHAAFDLDVAFEAVQGMSRGQPVYERILARASGDGGFMPPFGCEGPLGAPGCLTVEEFNLIKLWVEQGASNR